jgi:Flp pilus assembly protein TadB
MSIISNNPNASVTALAGAITIVVVWVVAALGVAVPAEVGSAFTTIVAACILWVGRRERREQNLPAQPATELG